MPALITNNAVGALATGINAVVTSLTLSSGQGALFPAISSADDYFYATLIDTSNNKEIIKVTARTGDTFSTIVRAQDGTTARSFSTSDRVELRFCAALFDELARTTQENDFEFDVSRTGAAATERLFRIKTLTETRWAWGANDTAESGAAVGSDFEIQSFDDDGVIIGVPFWIKRSTSQVMHGSNKADAFATGTALLFAQTAAPTGWTKSTSHDNKALRLVTGTSGGSAGGTTAFTSVFAARTIAEANLPSHAHSTGTLSISTAADHTHSLGALFTGTVTASAINGGGLGAVAYNTTQNQTTGASGSHTHTLSGSTGAIGSGTAMDFAVQYVDVIIATKDA